jgi:HlyD family secretion protein
VFAAARSLRLDETVTRANLAIVTKGLDEMNARASRLAGERDGAAELTFPAALMVRANEPDDAAAIDSERKLFELRRSAASTKVAAQGAHRPARGGNPRVHGTAGSKSRGDRADPTRARRRAGALEQEPGTDQPPHLARTEAARLKGERAVDFRDGTIPQQDRRDRLQIIQIDQI